MTQDHYKVLGVPRTTPEAEMEAAVKKAFRKQSMELHPDRVGFPKKEALRAAGFEGFALEAMYTKYLKSPEYAELAAANEAKFKALSNANDVLSDPQKRAVYDRFGDTAHATHRPTSGTQQRRYQPPPKPMREQVLEGIAKKRAEGGTPNLSRVIRESHYYDFTHMNLDGCIFSKADRPTTIYRFESTGSSLKGAIFDGADIGINVNFRNARNVEGMRFVGARFIGELPFGPVVRNMNFTDVEFVHDRVTQQFEGCKFNGASFMQRTSFTTAKFTNCEFAGTDLSKLTFAQRPQFLGCKFDGAKIHHSLLEHIPLEQRANIKLHIVDRFNLVHEVKFNADGLDIAGKFGAKPSRTEEPPKAKPKATEAPKERRGAFQWFDDWKENRAADKAAREAAADFGSSFGHSSASAAMPDIGIEPHKTDNKMGLMIAGAVVLVGGLIAAISMSEEKGTKTRKHTQRFPMPQPNADWQTRVNQPMPQSGASLL